VNPTGIRRVYAHRSPLAKIDGIDDPLDVDIAIIDTGVDRNHTDLNVVGGYNCTSSTRAAWSDYHGHGTHVAGTAAARDNSFGVVGVAPGARIWSVRILDSTGEGLLSWYVCGIDWITAQKDPLQPTRPLIEVANMSVYKAGSDDGNCGLTRTDVVHQAICRSVATGITYVAAAGNERKNAMYGMPSSYNEVITVSALADTDGLRGGLGGAACYSWGGYDQDDTLADFSNYGADVDLIAPGKCIYSTMPGNKYGLMSGTSMATPTVAGAAALYLAGHPGASPLSVKYALQAAGSYDWRTGSDKDAYPERLLDVSTIGSGPDFSLALLPIDSLASPADGRTEFSIRISRRDGFDGAIELAATELLPEGATVEITPATLTGLNQTSATMVVTVPAATAAGSHDVSVQGSSGELRRTSAPARLTMDDTPPVLGRRTTAFPRWTQATATNVPVRLAWSGSDLNGIGGSKVQQRTDGGEWVGAATITGATTSATRWLAPAHTYGFRTKVLDRAGNESEWGEADPFGLRLHQQFSRSISYSGYWPTQRAASAMGGSLRYTTTRGARASFVFTGRAVTWIAHRGPSRGKAAIYVDGVFIGTVDLYASVTKPRSLIFTKSWGTRGRHVLTIRALGTSGRPRVDLDAIAFLE
ncbi:MAG TPA: S8 family serine peptidase, partial [Candidatus Limnocylindrales bacterium]|nr:S8 family serine peptidase [Candidatus Limnocylindrales bacterium]